MPDVMVAPTRPDRIAIVEPLGLFVANTNRLISDIARLCKRRVCFAIIRAQSRP